MELSQEEEEPSPNEGSPPALLVPPGVTVTSCGCGPVPRGCLSLCTCAVQGLAGLWAFLTQHIPEETGA